MEFDLADQLERLVALIEGHAWASAGAIIVLFIFWVTQKGGLATKWIEYLGLRVQEDARVETRRIELIEMLHQQGELRLPAPDREEKP